MEIMKLRVKKSKDRYHAFEAARFIVDNVQFVDKAEQKQNCELAIKQLKKLSIAGLVDAQYLLANLYISGIPGFQEKHKADYAKAFNLYSSAAKKDHPEALFHVGLCYEQGAGVAQSNNRALHNYRKAAVSNHPGAMFRLGMCLLRGELNQSKNPRDGVKWLKLAAKYATEKYPQALYELALLHDHGVHNVVWPDHEYLIELLTQGAGLGHGGCQFKLGEAFEYGYFGVVVDPGRSVYYYSLAAANGNLEAMFELGGWYLTGASDPNTTFTLIQSDTEAYRWVSLAADGGLPKAMFAMGYFCEMGIGRDAAAAPGDAPQQPTSAPDLALALEWYEKAAAKGDTKAANKVAELRGTTPTTPSKRNSRMPPASSAGKARKGSAASLSASAAASATASAAAPSSTPAAPQPSQPSQPQSAGIPRSAPSNGAESSTSAKVDKKDKKKKKRGCLIM
ncbi:HCP-like protein [Powellomyces hirtus]|nr:HCP-like protein [Powellomyces hirtus]